MNYQPNIPTGILNLSVDFQNLMGNFQALDTIFGVDHVRYSNATAQKGYHESIHFNPVSTTATNPPNNQPIAAPSAVAGYGQEFSAEINDGINTDTALYFLTGGNRLLQMTRNFQPVISSSGRTFLPGGLILQWGRVNVLSSGTTTASVSFAMAFPGACFNVWTNPFYSGAAPNNPANVSIGALSTTSFGYTAITNSSSYNGFFWIALGN